MKAKISDRRRLKLETVRTANGEESEMTAADSRSRLEDSSVLQIHSLSLIYVSVPLGRTTTDPNPVFLFFFPRLMFRVSMLRFYRVLFLLLLPSD
ncbi:hypothetical protein RIF29_26053 [Crotalaria pallida]|uniref:Uncharacterized protein n=1 Tax=Crotalaria pallida TaxID=3830 RepID=A0AAN9EPQ1_CROPI